MNWFGRIIGAAAKTQGFGWPNTKFIFWNPDENSLAPKVGHRSELANGEFRRGDFLPLLTKTGV